MKEAANRGGLMQRWSGYFFRLESVALLTPLASRSAQDQANPVSRRRSWRRRPIGLPLWHIARTRLFSTWHPHCAPIRPDPRLPARQVPICSKLHTSIVPSNLCTRNYFEDRSKHPHEADILCVFVYFTFMKS